MTDQEQLIVDRLVEKSIEAFIMGLEIYNKPTIKYRIEGFSFFIINAWELMLKAALIKKGISIYYPNKENRTLSLDACLKKIYPDENTRIRINLFSILNLRNTSTHFITEEYETIYAPLFQACALNYVNELRQFHNRDITDYIPQNFLTVTARYEPLTNEQIRLKYPPEIAERFIQQANEIEVLCNTYQSEKFAIGIRQDLYITKKRDEADFTVSIDAQSNNHVAIVKELKDPANTHKYSFNSVIIAVKEKLKRENVLIDYPKGFNQYVLSMIIDFYNIKSDTKYAYKHHIGNNVSFTYSQQFVDFIFEEIKKDSQHFVENLRKAINR